ncbi:class II aldolase/adducin family protein [Tropicibacter sp. Alg240-R139]|uniref:class II aldolase/adducin family protein n=1 Tax=Tropicibacter sp. Alg240-R139 TaxID=2305991 RepID=UPI0013DEF9E8|nr:class II aldolase/adducin family protein [Tropicibacter sp. Alg240-R139]
MRHQQDRIDLAASLRLAARNGWQRGVDNHFSLSVDSDHFLVNARGLHWSEVTASNLLLVDHTGNVVEGAGEIEASAFYIHSHIHRKVPHARCVLHAHPTYSTTLGCIEGGRLENCHQDSLRFLGRVSYDGDFGGSAFDDGEGRRIAATIGTGNIVVMAHHGITVVGETVARAYDDFYNFEAACEYQMIAMASGRPLAILPDDVAKKLAAGMWDERQIDFHFAAMKRLLDRDEPDYVG